MLERDIIDRIEELHSAVVRAEAEQRFGLLRGKRSRQLVDAEAAERAFLDEQGFATYNDFRLRIRRSTSLAHEDEPGSPVVWRADVPFDDETGFVDDFRFAGPSDGDVETPSAGAWSDADSGTPTDNDAGSDDAPDDNHYYEEGSENMGPLPEPTPALAAPPPVPAFASRGDHGGTPAATADLHRLTEPLFATLQAETDRFVASRLEAAEKQAAEILNRASREAAEIIGRAARMHDAVRSLVDDVTQQSEVLLGLTDGLPERLGEIRESVGSDLQALRDLAESGPGKVAALAPPGEPSSVWTAPPRVAPPPPMPAAAAVD